MKILIVDDEPIARMEIRRLLEAFPRVNVVGEAGDADAAGLIIKELQPDAVLLDVELPGQSGFDLLTKIPRPGPQIIFITAYDQFAIRAFEANALDYLLKPVNPSRLASSLQRVEARLLTSGEDLGGGIPLREDDRVLLRGESEWSFVQVSAIALLECFEDGTLVHYEDRKLFINRPLIDLEARLPPRIFFRGNRTQIINTAFIADIQNWFSRSMKVVLRCRPAITVEFSRRQATVFSNRTSL
jgi:two-component system, LytTR family, response regulator